MGWLSFVKLLFIRIGQEDLNQKQEEYPIYLYAKETFVEQLKKVAQKSI